MGSKSYEIKAGFSVYASDEITEMNPDKPLHKRGSANAVWVTAGRFSNSGIVSDGYREGLKGVFLWYAEEDSFERAAVLEEPGYLAMMERFLEEVGLAEEGPYEIAVKDLSKSPIVKGVVKRVDYIPPLDEGDMELIVMEGEE